jgi:glycosyltransferase involved in cell wall biosynthesis
LNAFFCSQNALLDENRYTILEQTEKKFDAIYTAQVARFKRIHLASEVEKLSLITYRLDINPKLFSSLKKKLRGATWLNFDRGSYRWLDSDESAECLNRARVGLMLSAKEGANYASVEYFLCGLPLVTTPSIGGREVFYDDRYVQIVEPDPKKISAAVLEMGNRKLDPWMIRNNTIAVIEEHRKVFRAILDDIAIESGETITGREIWDRGFYHKFHDWISIAEFLTKIP